MCGPRHRALAVAHAYVWVVVELVSDVGDGIYKCHGVVEVFKRELSLQRTVLNAPP